MWLSALGLGFAGSLHCAGMCGPIALAIPVGRGGLLHQTMAYSTYHFGRITGYGMLGFLFGTLGYGFSTAGFQQAISILAGIVMLIFLWLPSLVSRLSGGSFIRRFQAKITGAMAARLKSRRFEALLGLGFFNAFLPCGLVYLALAGAIASYNPWEGTVFMMLFGIGTAPALLLIAFSGRKLNNAFRKRFKKFATISATCIALLFIIRGLGIGIPYLSPKIGHTVAAELECEP